MSGATRQIATPPELSTVRQNVRSYGLFFVVLFCLLLGGGGRETNPIVLGTIQLFSLVLLAIMLFDAASWRIDRLAVPVLIFVLLLVLTILLQLVPLPPAVWQMLPGRDAALVARTMLGADTRWLPFTLDPEQTRAVGYTIIPPFTAFYAVLHANERERIRLLIMVVAVAIFNLLLGVEQFATGGNAGFNFYTFVSGGTGRGLFANRNHNADFLLIASLLLISLVKILVAGHGRRPGRFIAAAGLLSFMSGVLITYSRTGISLMILPVCSFLTLFFAKRSSYKLSRLSLSVKLTLASTFLLACIAIPAAIANNNVIHGLVERFGASTDQRFDFWPDVLFLIRRSWPWGFGSGTFDSVFRSIERLDTVTPFYVNHAHNDFMEIVVELGLWGAFLIAAGLFGAGKIALRTFHAVPGQGLDPLRFGALLSILVLLLHSLVDYPLRTLALSTLAGVLTGLCFSPANLRLYDEESRMEHTS